MEALCLFGSASLKSGEYGEQGMVIMPLTLWWLYLSLRCHCRDEA